MAFIPVTLPFLSSQEYLNPDMNNSSEKLNALVNDLLTVLILTSNEEVNIGRVMDRLKWAGRVIVIDSYSTDRTLEIVNQYPNTDVFPRKFDTHARQWNY